MNIEVDAADRDCFIELFLTPESMQEEAHRRTLADTVLQAG